MRRGVKKLDLIFDEMEEEREMEDERFAFRRWPLDEDDLRTVPRNGSYPMIHLYHSGQDPSEALPLWYPTSWYKNTV